MTGDIWMWRDLARETAGSPCVKMARMKLARRKHTRRASVLPQRKTRAAMNPEMKYCKRRNRKGSRSERLPLTDLISGGMSLFCTLVSIPLKSEKTTSCST